MQHLRIVSLRLVDTLRSFEEFQGIGGSLAGSALWRQGEEYKSWLAAQNPLATDFRLG